MQNANFHAHRGVSQQSIAAVAHHRLATHGWWRLGLHFCCKKDQNK